MAKAANYRLALENAEKSIAQDRFMRALSKMTPEEQQHFLSQLEGKVEVLENSVPAEN